MTDFINTITKLNKQSNIYYF